MEAIISNYNLTAYDWRRINTEDERMLNHCSFGLCASRNQYNNSKLCFQKERHIYEAAAINNIVYYEKKNAFLLKFKPPSSRQENLFKWMPTTLCLRCPEFRLSYRKIFCYTLWLAYPAWLTKLDQSTMHLPSLGQIKRYDINFIFIIIKDEMTFKKKAVKISSSVVSPLFYLRDFKKNYKTEHWILVDIGFRHSINLTIISLSDSAIKI